MFEGELNDLCLDFPVSILVNLQGERRRCAERRGGWDTAT